MPVLIAESRIFGDVVPSTEDEMLIVRSGLSPWRIEYQLGSDVYGIEMNKGWGTDGI
jgi:hypothetical protein